MSKHKIEIKITAAGSFVTLFLISDDELSQLKNNSKLENPEPYYDIISDGGYEVYSGVDPVDGDTSIEIFVDGDLIEVDGCEQVDDDEGADALRLTDKNKLIINSDNCIWLEGDIPKNMHVLVMRESYKYATASVYFESEKLVHASDFELILKSTDSPFEFADVTYHAGILPTENDLVGIIFNGVEAHPEIAIHHSQDQELFLFVRNIAGELKLTKNNF